MQLLLRVLLLASLIGLSLQEGGSATIQQITDELESVILKEIEPDIERYLEWKRQTKEFSIIGPDCLLDAPGRLLRHRCCVVYSNLAAAMLYAKYGSGIAELEEYHATRKNNFHPQELDILLKFWAINSVQRKGIYQAQLTIQNTPIQLSKCEVGDAHTYLLLTPFDNNNNNKLIVDMSWKQILLMGIMNEHNTEKLKQNTTLLTQISQAISDENPFFVAPQDSKVLDPNKLQGWLQKADLWGDYQTIFTSQNAILQQMYAPTTTQIVCGKTQQEQQEEQQHIRMLQMVKQQQQQKIQQENEL